DAGRARRRLRRRRSEAAAAPAPGRAGRRTDRRDAPRARALSARRRARDDPGRSGRAARAGRRAPRRGRGTLPGRAPRRPPCPGDPAPRSEVSDAAAAEAPRPARAKAGTTSAIDRLVAAVPLVTAFLWLCLLYGWQAWKHGTPWLFSDELKFAALAR